jgi:hypothetical protein
MATRLRGHDVAAHDLTGLGPKGRRAIHHLLPKRTSGMSKASGSKSLPRGRATGSPNIERDLNRSRETLKRLRATVDELHQTILLVEENLQKAKTSAKRSSSPRLGRMTNDR